MVSRRSTLSNCVEDLGIVDGLFPSLVTVSTTLRMGGPYTADGRRVFGAKVRRAIVQKKLPIPLVTIERRCWELSVQTRLTESVGDDRLNPRRSVAESPDPR
jgi:hypothetical protein